MIKNDPPEEGLPPLDLQFEIDLTNEYSQYFLYSKTEILAVLRSVIQKGTLITVHFDNGQLFFLTSMLALRSDNTEFTVDIGSNEGVNTRALGADKLVFTTLVDKVKVQFSLNHLRREKYQGRPAFVGAVPEALLRLQRREFFRLPLSITNPVRLRTTIGPDDQAIDIPLLDISGGGVGLMFPVDLAGRLELGQKMKNCRIMLPVGGLLVCTLCVRNMFDVTTRSGSQHVRVGCEFVALPASHVSAVQRYIIHAERERKVHIRGMS
jgi:c-di-GMP-binding flagellar brake protein YcgR